MAYIHWNVAPEIFHIYGPLGIRWYSLLFLSGFLIGNYIFVQMMKKEGRPHQKADSLLFYLVVSTVIGARLGHCLFYSPDFYFSNPLEILKVWEGGLASHGGFLGIIIAMVLFSHKNRDMPFLWLADRVSIIAIMTGGFIRIGNLFNSEIVGKPTTASWAFIFEKVDQIPRHPAQIYEAFGYLSIAIIGYLVYTASRGRPREGRIFGLSLALGFAFRFFIEPFKENQVAFEEGMALNMGQLLSIPFVCVGLFLFLGFHKRLKFLNPGQPSLFNSTQ